MNGEKHLSRGWCSVPHRRHLLFILMFGAALFFFYTNLKETAPKWNPKLWMQTHSAKLFFPHRRPNAASQNASGSASANPTVAAAPAAGSETEAPSTASAQTQETVTSKTLHMQTTRPMPAPYVSPGPYLVEYPYEYRFVINEPQVCEQENPFVVILVHVAPRNRPHRDVIRSTWGNETLALGKVVKLFFLLGLQAGEEERQLHQELLLESKEHRDLIQSDFVDCYKNLTIKTMVMLEWVNAYCSSAPYAMKIDSDTFLNVPNLISMLLKAPTTNYMTGLVAYGAGVLRDPNSKWYLPVDIYPQSTYPPYVLGLGYILSQDLPKKLVEASRHVRALYIEDVYLGLCIQHLGIHLTDPPDGGFHVFPLNYNRCAYSRTIVTMVGSHIDRIWLWQDYKSSASYC